MLDGRVLEASQVEYKPFGKPPLQREAMSFRLALHRSEGERAVHWPCSQRQTPRFSIAASKTFGYQPGPTYGNRFRQDCLASQQPSTKRSGSTPSTGSTPSAGLPSCEARPGRRVNNSAAAGKLQGGKLRKNCVEGALERGLARRLWRIRPAASRQSWPGAPRREAGVPASSCAATKALAGHLLFWCLPPTACPTVHCGEQRGSALASALPRRAPGLPR